MIKKYLRHFLLIIYTLIVTNQIWGNLQFQNGVQTYLYVALVLVIFDHLIKPILKLLLLPITVMTLGLFRIIINLTGLYLAQYLITPFNISDIHTPATPTLFFIIPAIDSHGFMASLLTSITLSFVYNFINSLLIRKIKLK